MLDVFERQATEAELGSFEKVERGREEKKALLPVMVTIWSSDLAELSGSFLISGSLNFSSRNCVKALRC